MHTNLFNSQCYSMESPLHPYPDIHVHVHTEVQHAKVCAQCHGPLIDAHRGGKTPGVFLFDAYVVVIATAQSAQSVVGRTFLLIHITSFMNV